MRWLKQAMYNEYGGFADKRIKKLEKSNYFIVDDRKDSDIGADKKLLSYFCAVNAEVIGAEAINVFLSGNMPSGLSINQWKQDNVNAIKESSSLSLTISLSDKNVDCLLSLAEALKQIVAPGAQRYNVPSYKYVCPRTAASLERLHDVLVRHWNEPPHSLF